MMISLSLAALVAGLFLTPPLLNLATHKRWIRTQAKVISVKVDPVYLEVGLLYQPVLRYEFTANGNTFEGTDGLANSFVSQRRANMAAERFKQTSPIGVCFNPDNPNQSRVMGTTI